MNLSNSPSAHNLGYVKLAEHEQTSPTARWGNGTNVSEDDKRCQSLDDTSIRRSIGQVPILSLRGEDHRSPRSRTGLP